MVPFVSLAKMVQQKIDAAESVTILTHLNPDADTLGTGLGIFALLRKHTKKRIEIVNGSTPLPYHLDFLPNFAKIKQKSDFEKSLIITCDCGSVDRLGFDISDREVLNIDHHRSNTLYGTVNVVVPEYASASQVAYRLLEHCYTITADSASCFYTALLSDTRYFMTDTVNEAVFETARSLVALGADPAEIATHFTQRRSLASLRILERALGSLRLYREGRFAVLHVTPDDIAATGATMPDMEGIVDYARSLAVVKIALFCVMLPDGTVRGSLRSKGVDVSAIAALFGGGGHRVASGFTLKAKGVEEIVDTILAYISQERIV